MNKYPVTTNELAQGLASSGAALVAANNSIEEQVAMLAAGNAIIQDVSSVAAGLKIVAARLRGTTADGDDDTDSAITNVSKLQEKIKALTKAANGGEGINIIDDSGSYKSTYEILSQISAIWDKMDDMSQASLLELIAGKNRSSIVASVLSNGDILKKAYSDAFNSEGSADKELANQLDSIEGHISQFNNALQTMWMNFISDDVVKGIVDIGTAAVKLADSLGFLPTVLGGFSAFKIVTNEVSSALNGEQSVLNKLGKELVDFVNKKREAAMASQEQMTADAAETSTSEANAQANRDQAQSNEQVAKAAQQQSAAVDNAAKADANETTTSEANAQANRDQANAGTATGTVLGKIGTSIKSFTLGLGKAAIAMIAIKAVSWVLEKAFDWVDKQIHHVEYLREEVKELTDTYKSAKSTFDDNLETLTVSSDTESYATLLDEFEELTKGVNAYGENISLTSEQYGRYKEICEKIVGIQPSIADGYDSVTEAIGNNAGILSQLIELQKEEAKYSAQKYTNDENMEKIAEDAINSYDKAIEKVKNYITSNGAGGINGISSLLYDVFDWNNVGETDYGDKSANSDDLAKMVLQSMGYNDSKISDSLAKYYNKYGYFQYSQWIADYADDIAKNKNKVADAIKQFSQGKGMEDKSEEFLSWASDFINAEKEVKTATDGLVSTFLQVPLSMDEYDDLSTSSKSFITKWIKNSDIFKLDNDFTQEEALKLRNQIKMVIRSIADNDYTTNLSDGTEVSAQDILDQIFSIDTKKIDFGQYTEQMQELLGLLWDAIGGDGNVLGFDDKNALAVQLGIKFVVEDEDSEINTFKTRVTELTGKTEKEVQEWLNSLPVSAIEAMVNLDISAQSEGITFDDIENMVTPIVVSLPVEFKTYSGLSKSIDSFNEALETSNELFADGAKTTEDYFESLVTLGIDKDKLSEAIDPSTYIVTDVTKLKELIQAQKEELATETKLAKAQAQLQYHDLVHDLGDVISTTMVFSEESDAAAESILDQISAIKNIINQYQLLEDSLLGTSNAFDKFTEAQELDKQNTYGDSYVEMAQTMYDAIYKTGEVGSEAFWAAVRANVPEEYYINLTPGTEQLTAIADYLNENVFSTLTLDSGSFSIDYSDVENFVEKAQKAGVFTGTDASAFGLSSEFVNSIAEGENGLKKFAEQIGMTETQAYAMLTVMDQFNANGLGLSMLLQLDKSTTTQVTLVTNQLEKLYTERQALLKQGASEDALQANSESIYAAQSQLASLKEQAADTVMAYAMVENAIVDTSKKVNEVLSDEIIAKIGLTGDEQVSDVLQQLNDYLLLIGEPTVVDLDLGQEHIKSELQDLIDEYGENELELNVTTNDNGVKEVKDSGLTFDKDVVERYVVLSNADQFVDDAMADGLTTTETLLGQIAENTAIMAGKDTESEATTSSGGGGGGEASENSGAGRNDTNSQSNKLDINPEEVEYNMNLEKAIYDFQDNLTKKLAELKMLPRDFGTQNDIDAIQRLIFQAFALKQDFDNPNGTPSADLQVQLSELQTEAAKYGIEIPVTLTAPDSSTEMPIVVDIPIEDAVGEKIYDFRNALWDRAVELGENLDDPKNQSDDASIRRLMSQAFDLENQLQTSNPADVEAQLQELQAEAAEYGVKVPVTFVSTEEMPVVIDVPIDLAETYENYKKDLEELSQLGFNPSQTTFGNIDTNDRQVLEWNENNLNKYKEALMSWYNDMSWDDIVNDFSGTLSTVMGSSAEYDGVEIAFSPMLQTENGPVLLDSNTVDEYIWGLIDTANAQFGEGWTTEDLLSLDAQGLEFYGQIIKGLLADVGETAIQTSEAMHYTGPDGSIAQSYKIIEDAAQEAGVSIDEMIARLEGGENITITAEANTESAEQAGQEIGDAAQDATSNVTVGANAGTNNDNSLNNPDSMKPKSVKTYSQLESDFESLNSVLSQTEEIIGNGTEVTQSYKETLAELLDVKVSDLGEYFEESNELVVKNADGLKKLVKQAKNTTKQNVKLAKSQAQLEYYDLVRQLNGVLSETQNLDASTANLVSETLAQIDTVQKAIYRYELLEQQLLGAADAFERFKQAQEIDTVQSESSDTQLEMIQTIYDAYYKTGEVGSEAVREAVEGLIDPSVYAGLEYASDEYHQAIYKAFNKDIAPWLTLDEDVFKLDFDAVENFVEKGIGKIFTGTNIKDFDLMEGLNLEAAAEAMGMTETMLYAMLAALKLYDGRDFLSPLVDGGLDNDITETTSRIEELNREKLALLDGGVTEEEQQRITEINTELQECSTKLQTLGATAYDTWQEWTQTDAALNTLDQVSDKTQKVSDALSEDIIASFGLNGDETVQEVYDRLLQKQLELEQPTVVTAQLAIENIDSQIATLEAALENEDWENVDPVSVGLEVGEAPTKEQVEAKLTALKEDKAAIVVEFDIELSDEEKAGIEEQLKAIEQFTINDKTFTVTGDTSATMIKLQQVKTTLGQLRDKTITVKTNYTSTGTPSTGGGRVNGTANVNGSAFKGGSWGAPKTETALMGELGPEMLVRGNKWSLIGENGAQFTDVRRGDIIK